MNMNSINKLATVLLTSQVQAQVFHTRVNGEGAYQLHNILEEYYNEIQSLNDSLIESYQGKYNFVVYEEELLISNFATRDAVIKYFEQLVSDVQILSGSISEGFLESQVDDIIALIYSTLYKLNHLT